MLTLTNSLTRPQAPKTILLCSDDAQSLKFIGDSLEKSNYTVLRAGNGKDALQSIKDYDPEIDFLLSAFDMPEVNGMALATQVSMKWPNVKCVLMVECRDGTLILRDGWQFLPKPFVTNLLKDFLTLIARGG